MGLLLSAKVPRPMESNDQLLIYWIPYEGILGGSAVVDETNVSECLHVPLGVLRQEPTRLAAHEQWTYLRLAMLTMTLGLASSSLNR